MSFFRPSSQPAQMPSESSEPAPRKQRGISIWTIIAIIVIVTILIIVIILTAVRVSSAKKKTTTTTPPATTSCSVLGAPGNVGVIYNSEDGTAAVSWSSVAGAIRYRVYRKLGDNTVNTANYDQRVDTLGTNFNFIDLAPGTHYFVVTSFNACGESTVSSPAVFSPSCGATLTAPAPPSVSFASDDCGLTNAVEAANITFSWETSFAGGTYILSGDGQHGLVDKYVIVIDRDANPSGMAPVSLRCGEFASQHYINYLKTVQNATVSIGTATNIGSTFAINWTPIAGAEMYVIGLTSEDSDGNIHYSGGYASAQQTSIVLQTNAGDNVTEVKVRAFRVCDRSPISDPPTPYTSSPYPPII